MLFFFVAATLTLALIGLLRSWAGRHKHRLSGLHYGWGKLRSRLASLPWRALAYGLLLFLFLGLAAAALGQLRAPLREAGLLFVERPVLPSPAAAQARFETILGFELIILLSVLLASRLTSGWRRRALGMAPFVLVGVVCLLLLPVSYGALVLDLRHHPVVLKPALEGGPHYLLTATDQLLVIWDRGRKKLLWIPQGRLESLELGPREPIFQLLPPSGESP